MRYFAAVALILAASAAAQTPSAGGSIGGSIVDDAGRAIANADVYLLPEQTHGRSDSTGHFLISSVDAGFYHVRVRRLGYFAAEITTDLAKNGHVTLNFQLKVRPAILDSVIVMADGKCSALSFSGFNCRKRSGKGVFLTDDDILDRGAVELGEIFGGVPGFRVDTLPSAWGPTPRPLATNGSRCLNALVNGKPFASTNQLPRYANELIAVEIYATPGEVPEEYQRYVWMKSIRQTASLVGYDSPTARCSLAVYWTSFN